MVYFIRQREGSTDELDKLISTQKSVSLWTKIDKKLLRNRSNQQWQNENIMDTLVMYFIVLNDFHSWIDELEILIRGGLEQLIKNRI